MSNLSNSAIPSKFNKLAKDNNYNLEIYIEQLKNCYLLQECQLKILCQKVKFLKL